MRDTYQLGIGELVVDLRQTDLPSGDVPVKIDLGIGDARLIVPDDVCVATDAQIGIGEARTFDRHNEGVDVNVDDLPDAAPDTTRLLVKADVGIGSLRIGRSFSDPSFGHGRFDFGNEIDELERNEACAT
jgi:predicted membrane protein